MIVNERRTTKMSPFTTIMSNSFVLVSRFYSNIIRERHKRTSIAVSEEFVIVNAAMPIFTILYRSSLYPLLSGTIIPLAILIII